jgi:hypothetical protein
MQAENTEKSTAHFHYNDGGRSDAGYKGLTGDCVTRAIAIATGLPYQRVYDDLKECNRKFAESKARCRVAKAIRKRGNSPRLGVNRKIYEPYLISLGFEWISIMGIGKGCTVHVRPDELPKGRLVLSLSRHLTAYVDGILHDTYDCSREGTRCVYGYFQKP